jgi:hypothetical protein
MANLSLNLDTPSGWNKWIYAKSVINGVQIPDASFPYLYTPSSGFWARSLIDNNIPWLNATDALTSFFLGGGISGTLAGALGGLATTALTSDIRFKSQTYAVGRGARPPTMGFCLGNKFKQQVYTRMDVMNDSLNSVIVTNVSVDLLQNSRFKRSFIDHGSVERYSNNASEYILSLDINKTIPPPYGLNLTDVTITVTSNNSTSSDISVNVLGVKDNWDIIISRPSQEIHSGDYYKVSKVIYLENPYLLSGFWKGSENDTPDPRLASGLNLYLTSHNSPYEEGKILGTYIWKTDPTAAEIANGASSIVSTEPSYGNSMKDVDGYTWAFYGFGNSPEYGIYPNDKRYKEVELEEIDAERSIVSNKDRLVASQANYELLSGSKPEYLRIEIGVGRYTSRHNWYAPCLRGEYIKIKSTGKLHKILAHIEFNIIDVKFMDTKGTSIFDPYANQEYSIINQYAWFINEHYDGRISSRNNTGVFKGSVSSISENIYDILTLGDTYISTYEMNGLISFMDRYRNILSLPSSMKKAYGNFDGWRLVSNNAEYDIMSIDFSDVPEEDSSVPYTIHVELKESTENIEVGDNAYIVFDKSYSTFGSYSKESGYSFSLDVKPVLKDTKNLFIISDYLWLNGEFFSNPYRLDIEESDRIGFCDGYLFGLEINGSASSLYNQFMLFTTPRTSRGVASIFHNLRREDWVAYEDVVTNKITIRRGSMNFTEYPAKSLIVIGKPTAREDMGSTENPIQLNSSYEMLRRIGITFRENGTSNMAQDIALLFGIGSYDNIYGFYIVGDSIINLGTINTNNATLNASYRGEGYEVSPVYVYKPDYFQNLLTRIVDIGINTEDGPLYVISQNDSGDVEQIYAEYIEKNQTLEAIGFFDLIRFSNGEEVLIYGNQIKSFSVNGYINNNRGPNAVFIIGSYNDAFMWASPLVGRIDDTDDTNQYSLMILNSVDYLGVIYNSINETLCIFVRAETANGGTVKSYLGCYIVSLYALRSKNLMCEPSSADIRKFKWRPPIFYDSFIIDQTRSWTDNENIIEDGISYVSSGSSTSETTTTTTAAQSGSYENISTDLPPDAFIRVMGSQSTVSNIINPNEFGIISTSILPDGTYVVFYDSEMGIKAIYSNTGGKSWKTTDNVYGRNGRCGVLIGMTLYYITTEGIIAKKTNIMDFYTARDISAGIISYSEELNLQNALDRETAVLIGSGIIEPQRLSGYVTPEGLSKIFFYDSNGLLKCIETSDNNSWKITNNF